VRKAIGAVLLTIVAAVPCAAQTTANGEIGGRITDSSAATLPGVRLVIATDGERREAITDSNGRFALRGLKPGTYRVTAELPGFKTLSGTIALSQTVHRVEIVWPLEVGCSSEDIRVIFHARDAAPLADAIVQLRVISDDGPLLVSTRPECAGSVSQTYTVRILNTIVHRNKHDDRSTTAQILRRRDEAPLKPGDEYIAFLWPEWRAAENLVLPIVAGRVSSPAEEALDGMRLEEAVKTLRKWSRKRRR
jgi:hypothetical protein